jgi:hypothetical protein
MLSLRAEWSWAGKVVSMEVFGGGSEFLYIIEFK